jgi:hypothetical protein
MYGCGDTCDELVASEEEGRILLAEGPEPAIRAEAGRPAVLAATHDLDEVLEQREVVVPCGEINPAVEPEEPERWIRAAQQYGDDAYVAVTALSVEGEVTLCALPVAHPGWPENHDDGGGPVQRLFDGARPGLACLEGPAVEEDIEAGIAKRIRDVLGGP